MYTIRKIKRTVKEFVFGRKSAFVEPVSIHPKIKRSVYPKGWDPKNSDAYNAWTKEYKLSTVYHIKQTNNVEWK